MNLKDLATQEDLRREVEVIRREMDSRFALVNSRLVQFEQRLIIKLGTLMAFSIGIVAARVKRL